MYFTKLLTKRFITIILFIIVIENNLISQGTTCAGATSVTTNGSCTSSATISDATINGNATVCGGTVSREAWYIFTATGTTATIVATANNRNVAIELLSACGGTVVGCDNTTTANGTDTETLTVTGLTNGTNYIVRIVNVASNDMTLTSLCITGPVSAPSNDDPTGATPVTIGATCSYTTFTNAGATATSCGTIPAPGCSSYSGGDVWFSVVVPASGGFILDSQTGVMTDGGTAVYSGTACGVMTLLGCDDDGSANGSMPSLTITGQTPGSTLFIRFFEYGNNNNGTFGLCLTSLPTPLTNDEPTGATPITPVASCSYTTFTTAGASATSCGTIPAPGCASYSGNDVWFSVVVPASGGFILDSQTGVITDGGMAVYSGAPCGSMSLLYCDDDSSPNGSMPSVTVAATAGSTVYIRFWEYGNDNNGTFGICATTYTPPSAPSNNDPCGATPVTVNPSSTCSSQSNGSVVGATSSTVGLGSCSGNADDDVWYSFVATSTTHTVSLNNVAGSATDLYHSVHPGPCGSIGAALVCSDPNSSTVTGLTIGNTYFIRVYTYTSGSQTTTFSVCVTSPPPAPSNDDPTGATPITPASSCSYTNFTTVGATATTCGTIPAPGCASYSGGDVWFSVVVPASGGFILDSQTGGVTDGGMAVYSGVPCGVMSLLYCDDDSSPNGSMPSVTVAATPASTVYVRFWEYGNDDDGTFGICATTYTPPAAPSNNNPCGATTVAVNPDLTCTSQANGSVVGATSSTVSIGSCSGNPDDDVWFSFTATNTTHFVDLNNITGSATDMYHSVHPGPCGAIGAALVCSDANSSTVSGLTIGATYYIRVYTYTSGSQTTTFSVCVTSPPPPPSNDNPCAATSLTVNAGTTCTSQTAGTVNAATSSTVGLGSCFGNPDDDVWYSFIATNTTHNISLNNVAGSATDMYHSVHPGPCGAIGAALVCSDANSSTVSGLTIGTTYYIRVYTYTSGSQTTTFSVCVTTPAPPSANVDCLGSTPICGNASFSGNSNGEGVEEINGTNQGCIGFTGEQQSSWYTFKILTGGTLSFTITTTVDYDFAIWGAYSPTATAVNICPITTTPVRCSFAASGGNTGMGNGAGDNSEGVGGNRWVAPMNVTAGQVYEMLINNYAADLSSFTLTWGGTAVLDCSVILPLELISFTATNYNNYNSINWTLHSDIHDDYFILEHSFDGINFNQTDTVYVLPHNNEIKTFKLKDYKIKETTYYRLKQVKKNNSFLYSKIISAQSLTENDIITKVYPNPTTDILNVDVDSKNKNELKISLIDKLGNEYFISKIGVDSGQSSIKINLNNYDSGIYLLKIIFENSGKIQTQKIIIN